MESGRRIARPDGAATQAINNPVGGLRKRPGCASRPLFCFALALGYSNPRARRTDGIINETHRRYISFE